MNAMINARPGLLTERVQLRRRVETREPEGGATIAYVPIGSAWARLRTVGRRQGQAADGRAVTITHTAVLRFRSDIAPGDRLVHRGRGLEIVSAGDLDGRRAYLSCTLAETRVVG